MKRIVKRLESMICNRKEKALVSFNNEVSKYYAMDDKEFELSFIDTIVECGYKKKKLFTMTVSMMAIVILLECINLFIVFDVLDKLVLDEQVIVLYLFMFLQAFIVAFLIFTLNLLNETRVLSKKEKIMQEARIMKGENRGL